jgi:hypothetical protein
MTFRMLSMPPEPEANHHQTQYGVSTMVETPHLLKTWLPRTVVFAL